MWLHFPFFPFLVQVEGIGAGDQGNHAWAPFTSVTHLSDASHLADAHPCWCPHAPVGAASALYQPGQYGQSSRNILLYMMKGKRNANLFISIYLDCLVA